MNGLGGCYVMHADDMEYARRRASLQRLAWWHDDEAQLADLSGMTDCAEAHRHQARVIRERLAAEVTGKPCERS